MISNLYVWLEQKVYEHVQSGKVLAWKEKKIKKTMNK